MSDSKTCSDTWSVVVVMANRVKRTKRERREVLAVSWCSAYGGDPFGPFRSFVDTSETRLIASHEEGGGRPIILPPPSKRTPPLSCCSCPKCSLATILCQQPETVLLLFNISTSSPQVDMWRAAGIQRRMRPCPSRHAWGRRTYASTRVSSKAAASAPAEIQPSLSNLYSRRVWNQQHPRKPKIISKNKKDPADEKPWPKSVVYTAGVAAAIFVPYCIVWTIMASPTLRETLFSKDTRDKLRRHFGEADPYAIAYVDVLVDGVTDPKAIPHRLPGEGSQQEEQTQLDIQRRAEKEVSVRLVPIVDGSDTGGADGSDTVVATLPASQPATREVLLEKAKSSNTSYAQPISMVAIDFPSTEESATDDADASGELSFALDDDDGLSITNEQDPLLRSVHTYSSWHYQAPLQQLEKGSASDAKPVNHITASVTNEEIQIQQLEHDRQRLQAELRDPATTRPFDDIQEELDRTNATLRRLKWKRWVPW